MSSRIYSADEARVLRAPSMLWDGECVTPGPYTVERNMEGYEALLIRGSDGWEIGSVPVGDVPEEDTANADLLAASWDLAASVEHHAARADAAEAECVDLRHALDAMHEAEARAHQECARLRARVAELERLASGPRTAEPAEHGDAGLARPYAPETLPGWDGDGRGVSR